MEAIHIAVEGVIGSGKTTLARSLADHIDALHCFEESITNPFLERFYRQNERWAFACQCCFLEGRVRQFADARNGVTVVADHSMLKEPIFAAVNLKDDELSMYRRLCSRLEPGVRLRFDAIVYLAAGVDELHERIRHRDRPMEYHIDNSYLAQLVRGYRKAFVDDPPAGQRIVVVRADTRAIADDALALDRVVDACRRAPLGVSYCNPLG